MNPWSSTFSLGGQVKPLCAATSCLGMWRETNTFDCVYLTSRMPLRGPYVGGSTISLRCHRKATEPFYGRKSWAHY